MAPVATGGLEAVDALLKLKDEAGALKTFRILHEDLDGITVSISEPGVEKSAFDVTEIEFEVVLNSECKRQANRGQARCGRGSLHLETVDILMTPESNDSRFAPTVPFHSIDPFAGKQVLADRLAGRNRHTDSGILN